MAPDHASESLYETMAQNSQHKQYKGSQRSDRKLPLREEPSPHSILELQ